MEEDERGSKATLRSFSVSRNNPAYKLDCWWDMETELTASREERGTDALQ